jgi:hypothetical protein
MAPKSLEQLFDDARVKHLSETTLVSYRDDQLDKIGLALADAHLRLCLICKRRLSFLREELLEGQVMTELPERKATDIQTELQRLSAYINELLTAWSVVFSQPAMRGVKDGDEVFRHESKDGLFTVRVMLETDASLTFHFSSPELAWDGAQLRFRLGRFEKEVTLQREEDYRVAARIEIPRRERARKMNDISLEVVSISGATRKIL